MVNGESEFTIVKPENSVDCEDKDSQDNNSEENSGRNGLDIPRNENLNNRADNNANDADDINDNKTEEHMSSETLPFKKDIDTLKYSAFTKGQKIMIFAIIMFIGFLGPTSGNIYVPALPLLQEKFNTSTAVINATVSVFMAVFAIGPLFWGIFADFGGRKILYLISLLLMVIVNILLASLPENIGSLFFLRIMQAFSSSSVIALGAGTVTDLISPANRGKAIAYFMMGPNVGPIIAPVIAGLILINENNWRWLFGFTSIMSGFALLLVFIFLPETLRCIVGNGDPNWQYPGLIETKHKTTEAPWKFCQDIGILKPRSTDERFQELFPKPNKVGIKGYWKMLKSRPIMFTSVANSFLFANYYAFSVTFSSFLKTQYHFSMLKIGLCYVCPGLAMVIGSQTGGHLSDLLRKRWESKHGSKPFALEKRLTLNVVGIVVNSMGCIGYGWSIDKKLHIAIILFFTALIASGLTWCNNTTMTYLTEILSQKAASSVALSSCFRNIAAAISSLIISTMCDVMGTGWCFSGLGLLNILSIIMIINLCVNAGKWQS